MNFIGESKLQFYIGPYIRCNTRKASHHDLLFLLWSRRGSNPCPVVW